MSRTWGGMKLCRCGLSPEPKGQITEPGLTETVGPYIGCGAGLGWADWEAEQSRKGILSMPGTQGLCFE